MGAKLKIGAIPTRWKIGLPMFALVLAAVVGLKRTPPTPEAIVTASVKLSKTILPSGTARDWNMDFGVKLARAKHYGPARKVFEEILLLEPTNVSLLNNIAFVSGEQGDIPRAIEYLQTALQVSDNCAECHNNMGSLLYKQGKKPEAKAAFDKALKMDPAYVDAKLNMAILLEEESDWQGALDLYKQSEPLVQDVEVKKWVTNRAIWMSEIASTAKRQVAGEK